MIVTATGRIISLARIADDYECWDWAFLHSLHLPVIDSGQSSRRYGMAGWLISARCKLESSGPSDTNLPILDGLSAW